MLITTEKEIVLNNNTIKYYEEKGYDIPKTKLSNGKIGVKRGTKITIKTEDLKDNSSEQIWYQCDCCGEKKEISWQLYKQTIDENGKKYCRTCGSMIKNTVDYRGKKIGRLTILYPTNKRIDRHMVWHCKCDCGNECDVSSNHLKRGCTNSCGCLNSKGEMCIKNLLIENNISFEVQKTFNDCYFIDTNRPAFFDFYINDAYIIEFDGEQHFTPKSFGENDNEKIKLNFQKVQEHDKIKNNWCKKNNIPIIRIPYTHLKDLCIEDLLLETSKFVLNMTE